MSATPKAVGTLFHIHEVGEVSKQTWTGDFRAKETLSFRDKLNADRMRRELVGDAAGMVDPEAAAAALAIAQLSVRLTEVPEWWKEVKGGLDLADTNVLQAVWDAALKVEADHIKAVEADGKAAKDALRADEKKA